MKDNFFDNLEDYKENEKVKCVNCGKEFYQKSPGSWPVAARKSGLHRRSSAQKNENVVHLLL